MCIHCHQPVDNFGHVFEEAYKKSYEPFLGVLEKHPAIKLSMHYSGSLLDWITEKRPGFIGRLKALIEKGQVELLTGGHFEPVLSMVPQGDAKGQVEMLTRSIENKLAVRPEGIWLAERIWEPSFLHIFKNLNLKYTVLDDFHLRQAGKGEDDVFGYYSVKGLRDFYVFASIKKLRYMMPLKNTDATINFLKNLAWERDGRIATFADDCEKFGLWPYSYSWVYKKGWLDRFFTEIEESGCIKTLTFSTALKENKPLGEVDMPHSSYAEMMEWCGGNFRNFFKRYEESDIMRKRMLDISKKIENAGNGDSVKNEKTERARKELYKAQSNCAYWHGIFGGVYISYLRQGIYSHLIRADSILGSPKNNPSVKALKFEGNTDDIVLAQNNLLDVYIDPEHGGSISEIDYKPFPYNLVNTMSRRYEPYHDRIRQKGRVDMNAIKKKVEDEESIDLYEVLGISGRNLKKFLYYDSYRKTSLLCHAMDPGTSLSDFMKSKHEIFGENALLGSYRYNTENKNGQVSVNLQSEGKVTISGNPCFLRLNKCIILENESEVFAKLDMENSSPRSARFIFGVEFNWSINDKSFMRSKRVRPTRKITLIDRYCGLKVVHFFDTPMGLWSFPVYTLSESEKGISRNFQDISMLFYRELSLRKGQKFSMEARVRISR